VEGGLSLVELLQRMEGVRIPLLIAAFVSPVLLRLIPLVWLGAKLSGVYARAAAACVATGLVTLTFSIACIVYFHRTGTDLARDVDVFLLFAPIWFGLGMLYAGTRELSFSQLRQYPVLRRVWSLLMSGVVLFAVFLVLRHTYWVVFSGLLGFLVVAVVVWTLLGALAERALEPDGEETEELLDQVASRSRERLQRLSDSALGQPKKRPGSDDV